MFNTIAKILTGSFFICSFTVFSQNTILEIKDTVGKAIKTYGANASFMYENGFDSYEISKMKYFTYNKEKYFELKFNNTYSYSYCSQIMFLHFGKWHQEFKGVYRSHKILVWYNVDLFKNGSKYTIGTFGIDSENDLSNSVFAIDEAGNDLLASDTNFRKAFIDFFIDNIKEIKQVPKGFKLPR